MFYTMVKKPLWNLRCGSKKGFIFTLDSLIAVVVMIAILTASSGYMSKIENSGVNIQVSRTGSDITALLENSGALENLSSSQIESSLNEILPNDYNMKLIIECTDTDLAETANVTIGSSLPEQKFVGAGRRFFVVKTDEVNYCIAKYWTWKK